MYLNNSTNPIKFQGYRSKVKVTVPDFLMSHHCKIGKKFVNTISHEPLHLVFDEILREHVSRQSLVDPIEFQGHTQRSSHVVLSCFLSV